MKTIFGYGSLVNRDSLKKTIPNVGELKTGTIKGFRRVFNLRAKRIDSRCGLVAVLDIEDCDDCELNGVYFDVNDGDFGELKKREILYDFVNVDIVDENGKIKKGLTVQAKGRPRGEYMFDCPPQKKYLDVCLSGAKSWGNDFYTVFLKTTFIGNKDLEKIIFDKKYKF